MCQFGVRVCTENLMSFMSIVSNIISLQQMWTSGKPNNNNNFAYDLGEGEAARDYQTNRLIKWTAGGGGCLIYKGGDDRILDPFRCGTARIGICAVGPVDDLESKVKTFHKVLTLHTSKVR